MLDLETAKIIGINACIDKIGREFVFKHKDFATSGFGESEHGVFCFVGVDDENTAKDKSGLLMLDSTSKFAYSASCHVNLLDGIPMFIECVTPAKQRGDTT
jgi:hypothetical protein